MRLDGVGEGAVLHAVEDFAADECLGFGYEAVEVVGVELPHEQELDGAAVDALGVVAHHQGLLEAAHALEYAFDDLIEAEVLGHQVPDGLEHGVSGIGLVLDGVAQSLGLQQTCFAESAEFEAYGMGALAILFGKPAQMRTGGLVGEELHQQADACAGGDEGVEQKSFFFISARRCFRGAGVLLHRRQRAWHCSLRAIPGRRGAQRLK